MAPVAIATALVAALVIVGRGGFLIAPAATVDFYRRLLSTSGRMRMLGGGLGLVASLLITTSRQASGAHGDATFWIEGMGWLAAVATSVVVLAPSIIRGLMESTLFVAPTAVLRVLGALNVGLGILLFWVAFTVL